MEFDWNSYETAGVSREEVAECFEDPFSLRLLPDAGKIAAQSRFICLGRTLRGRGLFCLHRSTGKVIWVLMAREMTEEEEYFYNRRAKEAV